MLLIYLVQKGPEELTTCNRSLVESQGAGFIAFIVSPLCCDSHQISQTKQTWANLVTEWESSKKCWSAAGSDVCDSIVLHSWHVHTEKWDKTLLLDASNIALLLRIHNSDIGNTERHNRLHPNAERHNSTHFTLDWALCRLPKRTQIPWFPSEPPNLQAGAGKPLFKV